MSNEHECRSCQNTMKIYYVCESKACMNFPHDENSITKELKECPLEVVLTHEEVVLTPEEEKLKHLRRLKNEAMKRYRNKYPEKFHKKAREMSKNQYNRRKTDPDFLKKKCESSKRSYHKRKAERGEGEHI